jgi:hypothetical protein
VAIAIISIRSNALIRLCASTGFSGLRFKSVYEALNMCNFTLLFLEKQTVAGLIFLRACAQMQNNSQYSNKLNPVRYERYDQQLNLKNLDHEKLITTFPRNVLANLVTIKQHLNPDGSVGSSSNKISERHIKACAKFKRIRHPPEKALTG